MSIYLSNLGCARNLVDGEIMMGALVDNGFTMALDPSQADTIIVNTCSFIESAIDESVDEILELAEYKKTGKCRRLIVTGCLPERFREETADSLLEVDFFLGTGAYHKIIDIIKNDPARHGCLLPPPVSLPLQRYDTKRIPTTSPMVYLKTTEGCDRHCTYCIIPKLRGRLRSRPVDDIIAEATDLISSGFKEIAIIGQDTGSYGTDLKTPVPLWRLLTKIAGIAIQKPAPWIRFLYGSPDMTDESLIRAVASHDNICSYFDIPIQHSSKNVLQKMGRQYDEAYLLRLFDNIRSVIGDAALRTTVMVGFPGETDTDFKNMIDFVKAVEFDHLGAFIYSDADDLPSHNLPDHVPEKVAKKRHHILMTTQAEISLKKNNTHVDNIYKVLVEKQVEESLYIGRTWFQAPEVDGITYIDSHAITVGDFADIKITDAFEYDLKGVNA